MWISKVQGPHTLVLPSTLQNTELLLLKQWHPKIGFSDKTVSFIAFKRKPMSCYHGDRKLQPEQRDECKKYPHWYASSGPVRLKGLKKGIKRHQSQFSDYLTLIYHIFRSITFD